MKNPLGHSEEMESSLGFAAQFLRIFCREYVYHLILNWLHLLQSVKITGWLPGFLVRECSIAIARFQAAGSGNVTCPVRNSCPPRRGEASSQRERFERLSQDFSTDPIDDDVAFTRRWFAA